MQSLVFLNIPMGIGSRASTLHPAFSSSPLPPGRFMPTPAPLLPRAPVFLLPHFPTCPICHPRHTPDSRRWFVLFIYPPFSKSRGKHNPAGRGPCVSHPVTVLMDWRLQSPAGQQW